MCKVGGCKEQGVELGKRVRLVYCTVLEFDSCILPFVCLDFLCLRVFAS